MPRLAAVVLISLAGLYILTYLWLAYHRLSYPFDLEWIEGGMTDEVQRILRGESIYVSPSVDFVPFLYPPVYFYLSAAVSWLVGGGLLPLRIVSFTASLVSFVLIFAIVRSETRNWMIALLAVGMFAATFRVTGAWLDIARVDSLFVALWLGFVLAATRGGSSRGSAVLAGLLAALAVLTKQSAIIACAPVVLYLFVRSWKHGLLIAASATAVLSATGFYFQRVSDGWFSYYVIDLLKQQTEWIPTTFLTFWTRDLLDHVVVAILLGVFFLAGRFHQDRDRFLLWLSVAVGGLAASYLTRVKVGGYDNVLLPALAIVSILFGFGVHDALRAAHRGSARHGPRAAALVTAACVLQLVMLAYNPLGQVPTLEDQEAGVDLVRRLAVVPGEVFLPDHGYLASLAGKKTHAHHSAIWDVVRGNCDTRGKQILQDSLNEAIRGRRFDLIILDSDWNFVSPDLAISYQRRRDLFRDPNVFYTVTGWRRRPTEVFVPRGIP